MRVTRTVTVVLGCLMAMATDPSHADVVSANFSFGAASAPVTPLAYDGNPAHFADVFTGNPFLGAFNASLGTLTAVDVTVTTAYTVTSSVEFSGLTMNFRQQLGFPFDGFHSLSTTVDLVQSGGIFKGTALDSFSFHPLDLSAFAQPVLVNSEFSFNEGGLVVPLSSIGITGTAEILYTYTPTAAVPEASTWAMMLIGFAGLGFAGYRRSRRRSIAA